LSITPYLQGTVFVLAPFSALFTKAARFVNPPPFTKTAWFVVPSFHPTNSARLRPSFTNIAQIVTFVNGTEGGTTNLAIFVNCNWKNSAGFVNGTEGRTNL